MNKLTALVEAANNSNSDDCNVSADALAGYGDTILELCALLVHAEDALENSVDVVQNEYDNDWRHSLPTRKAQLDGMLKMLERHKETLAAIKQWKEQT